MPDRDKPNERGLFGGVFARGGVEAGDTAWLQAMLDAEAALARAARARRAGPGRLGRGGHRGGAAPRLRPRRAGRLAALTGNPVPALARALAAAGAAPAAGAVHRGATSQDILDTAAMLVAKRALARARADLAGGRRPPPAWPRRTATRS